MNEDLGCPICYCLENEIDLSQIIEGAVEQWNAWQKHEEHQKEGSA